MNYRILQIIFIFSFFAFASGFSESKVLIFTYSYNRADFIEIQHKTFKKFLKDDYEFVVFNDASNRAKNRQIHRKCETLGIRCIDIPQEIHNRPYLYRVPGEDYNHPSVRNSNVVQYSLDHYGFQHDGIVALFDSDLFLVKNFSIKEFMKDSALAGAAQSRSRNGKTADYLWIGLAFLDMSKMPDKRSISFNCGKVNGINVDAGGHTYWYLHNHPKVHVRYFNMLIWPFIRCPSCEQADVYPCLHSDEELKKHGCDIHQINFIHSGPMYCEFFQKAHFYHYRAGSNWDYKSSEFHKQKTKRLYDYIDSILNSPEDES